MLSEIEKPDSGSRVSRALVEREMQRARKAIGAYELRERLSEQLGRRVSANSVYRILKSLEDDGCARRVALSREWLLCDGGAGSEILLICDACTAVETAAAPADVEKLRQLGRDIGFQPERLVLEVVGWCAACRKEGANG